MQSCKSQVKPDNKHCQELMNVGWRDLKQYKYILIML